MQLLEMSAKELIMMGNSKLLTRKDAAKEFMEKVFKLRLGRGLYGECLVSLDRSFTFNSVFF